ncbi:PREDICTED: nascent polypeptide-associated complex subunit alpha, muscle-specific form-like, partial [Nipponia nippon]|uniref:nascent polypeptide-associated complex subunit alpha, muscle-specific form-like n=1 Tax=Nipponia nippon TaxID=128390 RepID=UPI000510AFF7
TPPGPGTATLRTPALVAPPSTAPLCSPAGAETPRAHRTPAPPWGLRPPHSSHPRCPAGAETPALIAPLLPRGG